MQHNTIPNPDSSDPWDQVVQDLKQQGGMAVVEVSHSNEQIHKQAFSTARHVLHELSASRVDCQRIQPDQDSAHATGYHTAGGMSRYNSHREGFVFSDGNSFDIVQILDDCEEFPKFQQDMHLLFNSLHEIAQNVLSALERSWSLPENWFQDTLGDTSKHSQWHIKRYVPSDDGLLLPIHTDPSIISVIIHDAPNIQEGCMGLEYEAPVQIDRARAWTEVPKHGHGVATIMVGSVLGYITGGQIQPTKHRVIAETSVKEERMAATLFLRPRGTAILTVPTSPLFHNVTLKIQTSFDSWNSKVSRNYMKAKCATSTTPVTATTNRAANNRIKVPDTTLPLPVLRSSAHTLKYSKARAQGKGTTPKVIHVLPEDFKAKAVIPYNASQYNFNEAVIQLLSVVDPFLIGGWDDNDNARRLDDFRVAKGSLKVENRNNDTIQTSQRILSDLCSTDETFLAIFDQFLTECIVPWMKQRLVQLNLTSNNDIISFYYQRPPTIRIQPGPSDVNVRVHCDRDYGHQDGELNFWMPLTDPWLNQTDLYVESLGGLGDYEPLGVHYEQVAAFHGSSCRHYVPANQTNYTRVSLDFRVGIQGYFDPHWVMLGTKSDHNRGEIKC